MEREVPSPPASLPRAAAPPPPPDTLCWPPVYIPPVLPSFLDDRPVDPGKLRREHTILNGAVIRHRGSLLFAGRADIRCAVLPTRSHGSSRLRLLPMPAFCRLKTTAIVHRRRWCCPAPAERQLGNRYPRVRP